MALWERRLEIAREAVPAIERALDAAGNPAWTIFEDVLAGRAWLTGIFPDVAAARAAWRALRRSLPRRGVGPVVDRELPDQDWRESYKAHFKAWRCGRLHWIPEWERTTRRIRRGQVPVYLDPGLAFGTGNHETTRLCGSRLVDWVERHRALLRRGVTVIDAGCGSGILAISAAKLGCPRVLAFDVDPDAVAIARENIRKNGAASRVRVTSGGLRDQLARRRAHLVLANIQADVLVAHADVLLRAVLPGGALVLSGILRNERDAVRAHFRRVAGAGWRVRSRVLGEWADVVLIAPGPRRRGARAP